MAKNHSTNRRTPSQEDDRRAGYKHAIVMLSELELSPSLCEECCIDGFRYNSMSPDELLSATAKPGLTAGVPGATQYNIVYRYLVKCRARSLDAEAGFCAILSDLAAMGALGVGSPRSKWYERVLKVRMPNRRIKFQPDKRRDKKAVQRSAAT